jgi:hypothetical protein
MLVCASAQPARATDLSVDVYKPDLTLSGTTCFVDTTSPGDPRIVEIDMRGRMVWSYDIPTSIVRGSEPHRGADIKWLAQSDHFLFVMPFKGVYEVNRRKEIVWRYETPHVSHGADRLPNGNTLMVFAWDSKSTPQVTEVNPEGKVVWQWLAAARLRDEEPRVPPGEEPSYTHANAAVRLPNGNTLVSLRNFHRIVEVNQAGEIVWQLRGLPGVHDPTPLPNGNYLLAVRNPQAALEVTRTGERVWSFQRGDVATVRTVQRLRNGNTLLAERTKLLEVTPAGEVVWQVQLRGVGWEEMGRGGRGGRGRGGVITPPKHQWFYKAQRIPANRS